VPAFRRRRACGAGLHRDDAAVTLATAHPAKFPDAVEAATGVRPALPPRMADLMDRPERVTRVDNDLAAIEALIEEGVFA
jgi:threonine synthase